MNADCGEVQFAARGPLVERLDVLQNVLEPKAVSWNYLLGQRIKHERIVRIRRMAQREGSLRRMGRVVSSSQGCHDGEARMRTGSHPMGEIVSATELARRKTSCRYSETIRTEFCPP